MSNGVSILLPLFIYPSSYTNRYDYFDNWKPAFNAIEESGATNWFVAVNPDSGPGEAGRTGNTDLNYIMGMEALNSLQGDRVAPLGYVHTNYGTSPAEELQANITSWASWEPRRERGVRGLFFDEASTSNFTYLSNAVDFAKAAFRPDRPAIVCNVGGYAGPEFDRICDVIVIFDGFLNRPGYPAYKSRETIRELIRPDERSRVNSAVLVRDFKGVAADGRPADSKLLAEFLRTAYDEYVPYVYFTSAGGYNNVTTDPITVHALAQEAAALNSILA